MFKHFWYIHWLFYSVSNILLFLIHNIINFLRKALYKDFHSQQVKFNGICIVWNVLSGLNVHGLLTFIFKQISYFDEWFSAMMSEKYTPPKIAKYTQNSVNRSVKKKLYKNQSSISSIFFFKIQKNKQLA